MSWQVARLDEGKWSLDTVQIRDFAIDKHRTVDDTPAGGGAGMVLRVDVLAAAVDHALELHPDCPVLAMTPRGKPLTQERVRELAEGPGVTILCGRFEGFDERIFRGPARGGGLDRRHRAVGRRTRCAGACSTLAFACFPA